MMMRSIGLNLYLSVLLTAFVPACGSADTTALFGGTAPDDYLRGKFSLAEHPLFVKLSPQEVPTDGRPQYLRKEAADALRELYREFQKAHPGARFQVVSATRTWDDQKWIWEGKWKGTILVDGLRLNETLPVPLERAKKILQYSSMPGTSRHHWGTDFDLNELYNEYYDRGEGKVLYDWMKENAHRFGFCQPYTAGRSAGYQEERWHWSYMPLSAQFLSMWKKLYQEKKSEFVGGDQFAGAADAGHLAPLYVNTINQECR
jgi:zinc D-Ala-D-Ala carboxypeptidase